MSEIHGNCVAAAGRGLLILGRPGAGKSTLALELVALGAALVADDRVSLRREGDAILASAPPRLRGLIEARGVGVLRLPHVAEVPLALALDLDATETARIPPRRSMGLLGVAIPLLVGRPASAVLIAALRHGPPLDPEAALPEA